MTRPASHLPPAATCTYALRFPNGEYVFDPRDWKQTTNSLALAHLWLWPIDESAEAREAKIAKVREQMKFPMPLVAVRART